jgi:hypothetical protein
MTEIERIQDVEIVEDVPSWEELVGEFAEGRRYEMHGQLRQARAAASVVTHYGRQSIKAFAFEVGKSPSWVYDLARVWHVYGHIFEDGDELSSRLETLGISHLVKSLSAPDPVALAERAHDEGMTTRQVEEEARGKEEKAEIAKTMVCPQCGGTGEVPMDEAIPVPDVPAVPGGVS